MGMALELFKKANDGPYQTFALLDSYHEFALDEMKRDAALPQSPFVLGLDTTRPRALDHGLVEQRTQKPEGSWAEAVLPRSAASSEPSCEAAELASSL